MKCFGQGLFLFFKKKRHNTISSKECRSGWLGRKLFHALGIPSTQGLCPCFARLCYLVLPSFKEKRHIGCFVIPSSGEVTNRMLGLICVTGEGCVLHQVILEENTGGRRRIRKNQRGPGFRTKSRGHLLRCLASWLQQLKSTVKVINSHQWIYNLVLVYKITQFFAGQSCPVVLSYLTAPNNMGQTDGKSSTEENERAL